MSDIQDQVHQATLDTIERVRLEERERIIKLLEDRKALLENPNNHYITAMNIPVTKESAMAITDATIWLIKGETNE